MERHYAKYFSCLAAFGLFLSFGKTVEAKEAYSYEERAEFCQNTNPVAQRLFETMARKQSNLVLAADVTTKKELMDLLDKTGSKIIVLKTHCDMIADWDEDFSLLLSSKANEMDVLIFEDRKFADIGNTVIEQYRGGLYRIESWSDIVNAHTVSGEGVITGLMEVGLPKQKSLLLVAEMSSKGNLISEDYTQKTVQMAKKYSQFVIGFICQSKLSDDPSIIHMTPGVNLAKAGDSHGQQYNTPAYVILEKGVDAIIVGRGITESKDPEATAEEYRKQGWDAYLKSIE